MIFKCTNKVREILQLSKSNLNTILEQSPDVIKHWYCNLFYLDRHKCLIFTQVKTLFSFLAPGVGNTEIRDFGELFRSNAKAALAVEGVSAQNIRKLIDNGPDLYALEDVMRKRFISGLLLATLVASQSRAQINPLWREEKVKTICRT